MIKKLVIVSALAAVSVFSAERICSPYFELVNLPNEFRYSSIKTLYGKMDQGKERLLVIPSTSDSISSTDAEATQIAWATSQSCAYLLQGSLVRLGESVQANFKLKALSNNEYPFRKTYKASTPDDLSPILGQVANALLNPKFNSSESIYDVTLSDSRALTKKRSSMFYNFALGYNYHKAIETNYDLGFGLLWDNRTFMGEINYIIGIPADDISRTIIAIRLLKPLNNNSNSVYVGGGIGLAFVSWQDDSDYYSETEQALGLNVEAIAGYLIGRTSDFRFRLEANASLITKKIDDQQPIGGGIRFILDID